MIDGSYFFQLKLLGFVYDCVNKTAPPYFHSFFALVESVHQYGTRQASKNDIFVTQKNILQYGLRSVRYFGAKCWNSIPFDLECSPSAPSFRQKLKAYFLRIITNHSCHHKHHRINRNAAICPCREQVTKSNKISKKTTSLNATLIEFYTKFYGHKDTCS